MEYKEPYRWYFTREKYNFNKFYRLPDNPRQFVYFRVKTYKGEYYKKVYKDEMKEDNNG